MRPFGLGRRHERLYLKRAILRGAGHRELVLHFCRDLAALSIWMACRCGNRLEMVGWLATVLLDCRPDQTIDAIVDRPIIKVKMPTGYHTQPQVNFPTEDVGFRVLHGSEKITTCYDTPV